MQDPAPPRPFSSPDPSGPGGAAAPAADAAGEAEVVARLRAGDESAYLALVERLQPGMLRLALAHCPRRDAAEEVVQETWLAVFEGISRFEGRSSLRTWIFSILVHRAKTRGIRERRSVPMSSLAGGGADADDPGDDESGPTVDPARFLPAGRQWAGHWASPPNAWGDRPEDPLLAEEVAVRIRAAIETLPERQRAIVTLRDVEGMSSEEVRNVLGLSETNQRVLLHRARAKVRRALETYFDEERPR